MLTDIQLKSVAVASSSEPTPELASFWQQKYRDLYLEKTFFLDQATEEIIQSGRVLKGYRPPRGYINLPKHILDGRLDQHKLEKTVEIAIRYLDDIISKLQLGEQASKIASNYRAIKVSIQGIEIYLDQVQPLSSNTEIKKIAEVISRAAYRASESLAEEKGVCMAWKKYCQPPTIRPHEMLYNTTTEEQKLYADFDTELVLEGSEWELYQRRNLTLIDFPKNSSWQQWDDYAEKIPKETIDNQTRTPFKAVEVSVNKDNARSISTSLQSSPYKQLFTKLLEKTSEQEGTVSNQSQKITKNHKAAETKADQLPITTDKNQQHTHNRDSNTKIICTVHVIVLLKNDLNRVGKITITSDNVEEDLHTMCGTDGSQIIHVFSHQGGLHCVYQTSIDSIQVASKIEFLPISSLYIHGRDVYPLIKKHRTVENVKNTLLLTSKIEEFTLQTTYYGNVFFSVSYLNGNIESIEGKVEKNQSETRLIFDFLRDTVEYMVKENIPIQTVIEDISQKRKLIEHKQNTKPLILATHILKIIEAQL